MLKKITITAALALASTASFADNKIGLIYIPSAEYEEDGLELDGDGFGVLGQFSVSSNNYITVEYSATEQDEQFSNATVTADIEQIRVGFGGTFPIGNPQLSGVFQAEFISIDFDYEIIQPGFTETDNESESGLGGHAGLIYSPNPQVDLYGQIGYLSLDELDGPEFKVGVRIKTNEQFSVFANYRASRLEADFDQDVDVNDIRLGAAIHF